MKNSFFLIVLLFMGLACAAPPQVAPPAPYLYPSPQPDRALTVFSMAQLEMSQGNYGKAHENLRQAMEYDPDSAYLRLEMARLLLTQGDKEQPLTYLRQATQLNPQLMEAWVLLGGLEANNKNHAQAIAAYKQALKLNPKQIDVLLLLSISLIESNQPKLAIPYLEALLKLEPDLILGHWYLGQSYLRLKEYRKAEKALKQTLEIDPTFSPAMFELARLHEMEGKYALAEGVYLQLQEINPDSLQIYERLGRLYLLQGRNDEALKQFAILNSMNPEDMEVRIKMGLALYDQGNFAMAAAQFREILLRDPKHQRGLYYLGVALKAMNRLEPALNALGQISQDSEGLYEDAVIERADILIMQGHDSQAQALVAQALDVYPKSMPLLMGLALLQEKGGDYAAAVDTVRRALLVEPNNADLYFRLGALAYQMDDKEKMRQYMLQAIDLNPNHDRALNFLGYSMLEESAPDLDEAESLIRRAFTLNPDSSYIIDSMGWLMYLRGNYQTAYDYLTTAAQNGREALIFEHLGDVCLKLSKIDEARQAYSQALKLEPDNVQVKNKLKLLSSPGAGQ